MFEGLSLNQIKKIVLEGESLALNFPGVTPTLRPPK